VVRNKARLVAQVFSQKEGIDYDETFTLVARLETIRILLVISVAKGIKLHQMDVKSAFLNGVCWHLFKANKHAEELLAVPPRCTGQTGTGHRSDRCRREDLTRDQRRSPGQDPVGAVHAGLS
jgi:hypothetical protein